MAARLVRWVRQAKAERARRRRWQSGEGSYL